MTPRRRRRLVAAAALVAAIGLTVGAWAFQPWLLFVDRAVDEALPVTAAQPSGAQPSGAQPSGAQPSSATHDPKGPTPEPTTDAPPTPDAPAVREPRVLRSGTLLSHEHETSGRVRILEWPDGRRVLRLENLSTTTGPDVRVWLSAAPVIAGREGWFVFDDHRYVELGRLKANRGNQNYAVPASADLEQLGSVTLWCRRFHVSFGAAALA